MLGYIRLCLRLVLHECKGNISKEDADSICLNYLLNR